MAVTLLEKLYTINDLIALPDDGRRYELHNGALVEVGSSSKKHALLGMLFGHWLLSYIETHGLDGRVTGADGTYQIDDLNVRIPDVAYFSAVTLAEARPETTYFPFVPDLVIEIRSPSNSAREMRDLAAFYLSHGARLVWTVDLETETVQVYRAGQQPIEVSGDDSLDGFDLLPGFSLRVSDIFAKVANL